MKKEEDKKYIYVVKQYQCYDGSFPEYWGEPCFASLDQKEAQKECDYNNKEYGIVAEDDADTQHYYTIESFEIKERGKK